MTLFKLEQKNYMPTFQNNANHVLMIQVQIYSMIQSDNIIYTNQNF